ncbi:MAG: hypothetical protein JNL50_13565 [Phycisphaerae bacterium]|nr:hypothetical protein [Phycisphaerae bacterium]
MNAAPTNHDARHSLDPYAAIVLSHASPRLAALLRAFAFGAANASNSPSGIIAGVAPVILDMGYPTAHLCEASGLGHATITRHAARARSMIALELAAGTLDRSDLRPIPRHAPAGTPERSDPRQVNS